MIPTSTLNKNDHIFIKKQKLNIKKAPCMNCYPGEGGGGVGGGVGGGGGGIHG